MSITQQLGIPFEYDVQNYANLDTLKFQDLGLGLSLQDFDDISVQLASTLDKVSLDIGHSPELQLSLGYPSIISTVQDSGLCVMRLSYVIDQKSKPNLIEVNSQTPSFWWECETGRNKILELNKLPPKTRTIESLKDCLLNNIKLLELRLQKFLKPKIGFVTCDSPDDIFQMVFLKDIVDSLGVASYCEILTIDKVDIASSDRVFSLNTDQEFDILVFWYPLEWLVNDKFADGSNAASKFFNLLKNNKLAFFNGMQSLIAQNKNLLAYINETSEVPHPNLTPTFYTKEEFDAQSTSPNWIGKPIFGREGRGIFGNFNGNNVAGDCTDDDYNNQMYVYQQMFDTKKVIYQGQSWFYTLEQWVYKTSTGWQVGGRGLRLCQDGIVDNKSIWVVLD
jgi:glutathionylspermidine synthase